MRFEHKTAIVTGAAQGIGFATARLLAQEGARVILADMNATKGAEVEKRLADEGLTQTKFIQCDVSNRAQVDALFAQTAEVFGGVDILINNAGITRDALFHKMSESQWDDIMNINLKSMFFTIQSALPYMIEQKAGSIVNLASVTGQMGNVGQTNYAASKAAVQGMTKSLCKEYARHGIRINAVAPGFTFSEMTDAIPEKVIKMLISTIPAGRGAQPVEIAEAIAFLASEQASFVNGQTLAVNGGMYL